MLKEMGSIVAATFIVAGSLIAAPAANALPPVVHSAQGHLDSLSVQGAKVSVKGWAGDADGGAQGNQRVHIYVDGKGAKAISTTLARPDVAKAYPVLGPKTGFATTVSVPAGKHTVCVYAISQGAGANLTLGCRSMTAPAGGKLPVGAFDVAGPAVFSEDQWIETGGWVYDPDGTGVQEVRATIDGKPAQIYNADYGRTRADVAKAHPSYGRKTGFVVIFFNNSRGLKNICLWAVNQGAGPDVSLGCKKVSVIYTNEVIGSIDKIVVDPKNPQKRIISGWVLAPDDSYSPTPFALVKTDPTTDYYWMDSLIADLPSPTVDKAYPKNGKNHGFRVVADLAPDMHGDVLEWKAGDKICIAPTSTSREGYPGPRTKFCAVFPG